MKLASRLSLGLAMFSTFAIASAQEVTMAEILKGTRFPLTLQASAIPDGYTAVKIKAGEANMLDMIGGPFGMMMGMLGSMGGQGSAPELEPLLAMEMSWSNGDMATINGQPFLVTYKIEMEPADMMAMGDKEASFDKMPLKMTLIRLDSIKSMTPRPDLTPARFVEMLKKKPSLAPSGGTAPVEKNPAPPKPKAPVKKP
jgi:hypothetical protein